LEADANSFDIFLAIRMILGFALGLLTGRVPSHIDESGAVEVG